MNVKQLVLTEHLRGGSRVHAVVSVPDETTRADVETWAEAYRRVSRGATVDFPRFLVLRGHAEPGQAMVMEVTL